MARLFEKRDGPFRAHIPGSKSISHKYQYQSCPKSVTAVATEPSSLNHICRLLGQLHAAAESGELFFAAKEFAAGGLPSCGNIFATKYNNYG